MSSIIQKDFLIDSKILCKKGKYFHLNLNEYRNTHYQVLNMAKKSFNIEYLARYGNVIKNIKAQKMTISYFVIPTDNRRYDLMNVVSVVDKFFLDFLVKNYVIPDDNINRVSYGTISAMGPDPEFEEKMILASCTFYIE